MGPLLQLTETRIEAQQRDRQNFLNAQPATAEQTVAFEAKLKTGEILVQKLTTTDQGKSIEAPGALIHDWVGTAFIQEQHQAGIFSLAGVRPPFENLCTRSAEIEAHQP